MVRYLHLFRRHTIRLVRSVKGTMSIPQPLLYVGIEREFLNLQVAKMWIDGPKLFSQRGDRIRRAETDHARRVCAHTGSGKTFKS